MIIRAAIGIATQPIRCKLCFGGITMKVSKRIRKAGEMLNISSLKKKQVKPIKTLLDEKDTLGLR